MPSRSLIRLRVSQRTDFIAPACALYLLSFIAALVSPYPFALAAATVGTFAIRWLVPILDFSKSNNHVELTSVIFPDGKIQLESGQGRLFVGVLDGRQWCCRHLAVLRVTAGNRRRNLVITPGRQVHAGEFRRLGVWLRQDLCNNAGTGS